MTTQETLKRNIMTEDPSLLSRCPVVPVVVLDDPGQALPLGEALLAGGIDIVEITLRTDAGLEAIRRLATLPGMHVGAGSVLVPTRSITW
jgi:2-dehydro-3-deoxyphosphogluconate aldolase / (4S)-4-hydroxy-2-oxoglutarate aldolase